MVFGDLKISHELRIKTEYNDRDFQYHALQRLMGLRKVRIWSFSKLNFVYTVLSKRKLQWFVDNGKVPNWNDPRFPTVQVSQSVQATPVVRREFNKFASMVSPSCGFSVSRADLRTHNSNHSSRSAFLRCCCR